MGQVVDVPPFIIISDYEVDVIHDSVSGLSDLRFCLSTRSWTRSSEGQLPLFPDWRRECAPRSWRNIVWSTELAPWMRFCTAVSPVPFAPDRCKSLTLAHALSPSYPQQHLHGRTKFPTTPSCRELAGISSVYTLLIQRRMRRLGHAVRVDDGRIPKDLLYRELAEGKFPTAHHSCATRTSTRET